jgi:hypothetical protein
MTVSCELKSTPEEAIKAWCVFMLCRRTSEISVPVSCSVRESQTSRTSRELTWLGE